MGRSSPGALGVLCLMFHPADRFAPGGLIHDRFMNSWQAKVQSWSFHWWPAQELRRIHLNDRDLPKDGWTYLYDFKDHPPSNYCIILMSYFIKSRSFIKIAEICIWCERCARSPKVTEGGEIKKHDTKKLRKGARFRDRPCGKHAAPGYHILKILLVWAPLRVRFLSCFPSPLGCIVRSVGLVLSWHRPPKIHLDTTLSKPHPCDHSAWVSPI